MALIDLEDKIIALIEQNKPENFIYEFMILMGIPKATVTRVQSSDRTNLATTSGDLHLKNKLYYRLTDSNPFQAFSEVEKILDNSKGKPRFTVVTNFSEFLAKDNKTNDSLKLDDIRELAYNYDFFLPWQGIEKADYDHENPADVKAAERIAKLYDVLRKDNPEMTLDQEQNFNVFLIRILFMLFAEDTNIMKDFIFTNAIKTMTAEDGSDMNDIITTIFELLDTHDRGNVPSWLKDFPYVNGQLFTEPHRPINFSTKSRKLIIEAGERLNWKDINPDIFGSMVQSVATEDNRSHLGMHYTSVPNIMKVIRPLFLDELNKTFEDIILLSDRLEQQRRLNNLRYRISKIKFFDPASGSGNFLIITYKEIRRLEIKIMQTQISLIEKSNLQERNKVKQIRKIINSVIEINLLNPDEKSCVHLGQFYGIEIDPFAHEVARLSLWIAEHQMNMELMSVIPNAVRPTLPLQKVGDIRLGNALQIDWQEFLPHKKNDEIYIFGNPPYKGSTEQNNEQKSDMEHVFKKNYKRLDYIAAWFELASRYIATSKASFAFVTTNSINQGTQVSTLWPLIFQRDLEIFFAVPSFKWKNSAKNKANVIVSIVGMRSLTNENKKIYRDNEVSIVRNINAYLVPHDNFIIRRRTKSISSLPALIVGNRPNDGGGLIFSISEYNESINRFPELNSIFSKFIGGKEFTNNTYRYILWMSDSDAKIFKTNPIIKERLKKVSETRNKKNIGLTLAPWQLQNVRNEELMGLFIPQSSSSNRDYLPMGLIDKDVKISDPNFVLYNPELWLVGTLMSRMHMVWIKVISGKLKSDYRYSVEMVYNTFPIPIFSTQRKNEVDRVVRDIFDLREEYGLTLSELYNNKTMPRDLRVLHERLDGIVERAYRQTPFKDDQERLGVLLNMYKEMTKDD